jgi:hypothetical protein
MTTREKFEPLADQWVQHCRAVVLSSNIKDYLDHPSYRELVSLGNEAVPYIMDRYREDDFTPWGFLLDDITGVGMVENRNRFKPGELKQRWLAWWRTNSSSFGNGEDGESGNAGQPGTPVGQQRK